MTTINFVPKQEFDRTQLLRIRHLVILITTVGLVIYLVVAAGIFGWWWYGSVSEKKTSVKIEDNIVQIRSFSESEVAARRLGARTKIVNEFLSNRGQASDAAQVLAQASDVEVATWVYNAGGEQQVKVRSQGPGQIFAFSKYLEEKYERVQVAEAGWNLAEGWYGRFSMSGRKKGEI